MTLYRRLDYYLKKSNGDEKRRFLKISVNPAFWIGPSLELNHTASLIHRKQRITRSIYGSFHFFVVLWLKSTMKKFHPFKNLALFPAIFWPTVIQSYL